MSQSSLSLSDAVNFCVIAAIGVILYVGFAYLVNRSKNIEVKRRWRYSILWGVSYGVFAFILLCILSVLALFGDENEFGYMVAIRSSRSPLDFFIGIVLFFVYPVLISLPLVFLITLVTYGKELQNSDMFVNSILNPAYKHFSDRSPDSVFERLRIIIANFVDG
jgi:hypothetical protein